MKLNYPVKAVRFAVPTKSLDSLPNDVLVDHLFKYLDVLDMLRLRQVRLDPFILPSQHLTRHRPADSSTP